MCVSTALTSATPSEDAARRNGLEPRSGASL